MSSSFHGTRRPGAGFSLTEMLVVIAVISTLLAISLPALTSIRENARTTACASNIRQIGTALNTYENEFGSFPPGQAGATEGGSAAGTWLWPVFILPQLENVSLFKKLDLKKGPYRQSPDDLTSSYPAARHPLQVVLPFFICPAVSKAEDSRDTNNRISFPTESTNLFLGCMDYVGLTGPATNVPNPEGGFYEKDGGMFLATSGTPKAGPQFAEPRVKMKHVRDGLFKTILLAECTGRAYKTPVSGTRAWHGAWAVADSSLVTIMKSRSINSVPSQADYGNNLRFSWEVSWAYDQLYSDHRGGGCNVVMCDTSVQFLRDTISTQVLAAMSTRAGGERVVQAPDGWVLEQLD